MSLFSRSSRRQVGVDIGTSSIKAVETEQDGSRLRLSNYGIIEGLDFFGSVSASPKTSSTFKISESEISVVIRKLFDLSEFTSKEVVFSIPIFSTFLTTISLPQMEMKELERAVQFQARSHIPVPLSEVTLDWIVLPGHTQSIAGEDSADVQHDTEKETQKEHADGGASENNSKESDVVQKPGAQADSPDGGDDPLNILESAEEENEAGENTKAQKPTASAPKPDGARTQKKEESAVSVLLVAVPQEIISKYQNIAREADLTLKGIEVESFSLVRSLLGNDPQTTIIVDFGMRSTALTLVDRGFVHMSHTVDFSGRDITRAIERGLSISFERAEEIKKTTGLTSGDAGQDIERLVSPFLNTVTAQLEAMAGRYLPKDRRDVDRIILTGGTARLPGLKEYIEKQTSVQTVVGNPFARLAYPSELTKVLNNDLATTLAAATGLAMRE